MDMIADIFLVAGAAGAALYCLVLARRLKRLTQLEGGMGSAIAVLSAQVDDLTRALSRARNAAADSTAALEQQTNRAETALQRMELMMAAMHDLPPLRSAAGPHQRTEATAVMMEDRDTTPRRPDEEVSPEPASRVLPWKSVRQDAGAARKDAATDTVRMGERLETPHDARDTREHGDADSTRRPPATAATAAQQTEQAGAQTPPDRATPENSGRADWDGREDAPGVATRRVRVVRRRALREAAE